MEDLHSIAYNNDIQQQMTSSALASYSLDFHNLSLFNSDMLSSSSQFMVESTPPFLSSHNYIDGSSDYYSSGTGYLQDALLEFSSKRRRLKFSHDDDSVSTEFHDPNLYNSEYSMNFHQNYDYFTQMMTRSDSISGDFLSRSSDQEQEVSVFPESILSNGETFEASSSSFHKAIVKPKSSSDKEILHFPSIAAGNMVEQQKRKKKTPLTTSKVVYPFALVKPGGEEGDVTLNDINQRILMPPTRPVRHPVGEFACRPIVTSSDGPGLSGKEVVTLTRIRTHGRGTITIIRTKN